MKYTLHKLHNPARGRWRCKLIIGALLLSLVLGTVMGVWVSAETDATATVRLRQNRPLRPPPF